MQIIIFIIGIAFLLIFLILGLKWDSIFSVMGFLVGLIISIAAQIDGTLILDQAYVNLAWVTYTVSVYPIIWIPIMLTLMNILVLVYKVRT